LYQLAKEKWLQGHFNISLQGKDEFGTEVDLKLKDNKFIAGTFIIQPWILIHIQNQSLRFTDQATRACFLWRGAPGIRNHDLLDTH
jgi:hypothetical protein